MDRVYKSNIPAQVKELAKLRTDFAALDSKSRWIRLRIDPLLAHAQSLESLLRAAEFSREVSRLRRGVEMFHADLVYFRDNIRGLKKALETESKTLARSRKRKGG